MADDRIREWALTLVEDDARAFMQARRRFLSRPSAKRLHDLRTRARRLRSLTENLCGILDFPQRRRLHRLIELTGETRDATVLRQTLRTATDARERESMRPLRRKLRRIERRGMRRIRRALARLRLNFA